MRSLIAVSLLTIFIFLTPLPLYATQDKVVYNLPYTGILPDHPLYFVKSIRDKILELATRDNLKKAELYLLFSDKSIGSAESLAQKGKDKQAISSLIAAEKYFKKMLKYTALSKKQGASASAELIQKIKLSNEKHREIIENLQKNMVDGQSEIFKQLLQHNEQNRKEANKL